MIVRALVVLLLLAAPAWALDQSPHCRIKAYNGNSISCGSGTLIDDDTVVTCSHLFDDGASRIAVEFPSGVTLQARIAQRDKAHDLCTLQLSQPTDIPCVPVAERGHRPQRITVCGYGSGSFRSASGPIVDSERTGDAQYQHLVANVAVRSGDSGGGVLDESGNVTGVIWGCADGQVRFFGGEPLWRIVEQTQCYGGSCRPVLRPIAPSRPAYQPSPKPAPQGCECGPKWESIEAKLALIARLETRIAALESRAPVPGPPGPAGPPGPTGPAGAAAPVGQPPNIDEITQAVIAKLDHETPIRVYLPDGRLVGESKTNLFRESGSIDHTFDPRALLDSAAGER